MSEYLAPGVYVEETNTGNKPIEGVSTSTAGLIGVTERGPVNVPTLVTSFGEYRRTFGGYLDKALFTDPTTERAHYYLPHAVEGFFVNGGKRAWLTRVAPTDATRADRRLFFPDTAVASPADTVLLRPAEQGTGTSLNQPLLYVLSAAALSLGDVVRIGDGSRAEYRTLVASPGAAALHVSLNLSLQRSHAVGATVREVTLTHDPVYSGANFKLAAMATPGSIQITVTGVAPDPDKLATLPSGSQLLEIGSGKDTEYVMATAAAQSVAGGPVLLTLANALQRSHPVNTAAVALTIPLGPPAAQTLTIAANSGDSLLYLDALGGGFTNTARLVVIEAGSVNQEVRRIGMLAFLSLDLVPYQPYPAGSVVERVFMRDDDRDVSAGTSISADLDDVSAMVPGMSLLFSNDPNNPVVLVSAAVGTTPPAGTVTFTPSLGTPTGAVDTVTVQPRTLTATATAGAVVISLDNRLGLLPGDVLRIGVSPNQEYLTIRDVPNPRSVPPDAGSVVLDSPLRLTHGVNVPGTVRRQNPLSLDASAPPALLVLAARVDETSLLVTDSTSYGPGDVVRVTAPSGDVYYHHLNASPVGAAPRQLTLAHALVGSHSAGATVAERERLLQVRALDPGGWGNRVLVSTTAEESGLLARAEVTAATPSPGLGIQSTLRLTTVTGVEAGTVLELRDPADAAQVDTLLKVRRIDRAAGNLVILDPPGLQPNHMAAFTAAALAGDRLVVHSREFRMQVLLLQQPSAAVPSRNDDLLDGEVFRHLSMDPRHSRYVERFVGSTWVDGAPNDDLGRPLRRSDRRSEGTSQYIRVQDLGANDADKERVRLGPEELTDVLASGLSRPARLRLGEGEDNATRGDDSMATIDDAVYLGVDDPEPELRTGIYAMKNIQTISLVAAPGQSTPAVQQALIDHCEDLRYRFAVLDAQGPSDDTLADVQAQRQQFDTKYAAMYHPWLTIPDPFPTNLASIAQYPIPPSGHVLGIYARTDIERGVHKAPANEVVRGIVGLTRHLNKGEHDILNAYPVHIDVIRDFRPNNRGIRVWGARCITSDTDYKYVNVRRLLIFLEASLDQGLQWVVFEPNAEELWARVRRSITNFLTVVWRNGALEGTTREQGFFVKCDRTTMTQTDIDNGRLICVIGVAPVKPAEFVIIRIGLWTADANS